VPRRINTLFNRLLLFGALEERDHIRLADLEVVLEDLRGEVVGVEEPRAPTAATPAAADGAIGAGGTGELEMLRARVDELESVLIDVLEITARLVGPPAGDVAASGEGDG
jgi:hypothetical protein